MFPNAEMIDVLYATIPVKAFKNLLLSPSPNYTTAQTSKSETLDTKKFVRRCQAGADENKNFPQIHSKKPLRG